MHQGSDYHPVARDPLGGGKNKPVAQSCEKNVKNMKKLFIEIKIKGN